MIAAAGLVFSPAWGQSDNIDTLSRFGSTGTPSRAFKAVGRAPSPSARLWRDRHRRDLRLDVEEGSRSPGAG
jgi:hypothetical protein